MPIYTRGSLRDQIRFVLPFVGAGFRYGFLTKDLAAVKGVTAGDISPLGHILPTALGSNPGVMRANAPKPPRVRFTHTPQATATQQKSISTFCSADKLKDALRTQKWRLAKPALSASTRKDDRNTTAAVLTGKVFYCFPMNSTDFSTYSSLIGAESKIGDAESKKIVWGSSQPRPAKMGLRIGGKKGTFSTYVADRQVDNLRGAGWKVLSPAIEAF